MPVPAKINKSPERNPRVLVAPLDWGLGHATRCIPVIKELINQRCKVIVACTGAQEALLRVEFPSLTFAELRGYEIKYDKNRALTILRLMRAIPKILIRIKQEKAWLGHFAAREKLDLVISDNRYGLTIPGIPCIFITHQLLIKTPFGHWADRLLQSLNYRTIRRFSRCWIPDIDTNGLAGELSHPQRMPPLTTRYIGWLSRFGSSSLTSSQDTPFVLALLSGPEPQRTLLEKDILRQAQALPDDPLFHLILVRGLPGNEPAAGQTTAPAPPAATMPWITIHNHLPSAALEPLLKDASLVIARPGYSTVMDLERLGKRALFIPTPGQSEQEYLGPYLATKGWAACTNQHAFSLSKALELAIAGNATRERQPEDPDLLAKEVKEVLGLAGS